MNAPPSRLLVRIESTALPDETAIIELDGREAISELFRYRLLVRVAASASVDAATVIGTSATMVFEHLEGDKRVELRRVHGVICSCEDLLRMGDANALRIEIVPRLWMSTLVETLDIHQDVSVPDIVRAKLGMLNLVLDEDFELRLTGQYPEREFTVQYKETDLAFVSRLTEHLGISFVFEHDDQRDKLVLVDHAAGFRLPAHGGQVHYAAGGDRGGVCELVATSQIVPSNFFVRDYNYRNPGVDLMAEDSFDGFGGGVVEYGGHFKDADEGSALAAVRRQERQCRARVYRGESADPRIAAGMRTQILNHPRGDLELLPFVVHHRLRQTDFLDRGESTQTYTCSFEAIDAAATFRPERKTQKPRVQGVLTGIVDGTGTDDYADIDDTGRYRVRFMFDTSGNGEGQASRPVRMMQPHSGGGYGMHFPLRRGVEVLITFIDGDPDRPIICGTVPNPQTPSPVAAANNRRNIIRTGGGNEINIDDTAGSERIKLTVPHQDTIFQLGAPNAPESGAHLQTKGSLTKVISGVEGSITGLMGGIAGVGRFVGAGSIASVAGFKFPAMGLATLEVASKLLSMTASGASASKALIDLEEKQANEAAANAATRMAKRWQKCRTCLGAQEKKIQELPAPLQPMAKALHHARTQYGQALVLRRKRDKSLEAGIGQWIDTTEASHTTQARWVGGKDKYAGTLEVRYREAIAKSRAAFEKPRDFIRGDNGGAALTKQQVDDIVAKLQCDDCTGLMSEHEKAEESLDAYHRLRAENSDDHAMFQAVEAYLGKDEVGRSGIAAVGVVTGGLNIVKNTLSAALSVYSMMQLSTAHQKFRASWKDASAREAVMSLKETSVDPSPPRTVNQNDFTRMGGAKRFVAPLQERLAKRATHTIGSDGCTQIRAEGACLVTGRSVRVSADKHLGISTKLTARVAAGNDLELGAKRDVVLAAEEVKINIGESPRGATARFAERHVVLTLGKSKPTLSLVRANYDNFAELEAKNIVIKANVNLSLEGNIVRASGNRIDLG